MFDLLNSAHTLPLKPLPRSVKALGVPTPVSVELCDGELRAKREAVQGLAAAGRGAPPSRPPEPGDWRLEVHVIRCASLAPCDTSGTPKAYANVHWLGQTLRTSADGPRSSDPTWDARLLFTAQPAVHAASMNAGVAFAALMLPTLKNGLPSHWLSVESVESLGRWCEEEKKRRGGEQREEERNRKKEEKKL